MAREEGGISVKRVTEKDAAGHYYMTGDGIFLVRSIRDRFMGEDVDKIGEIEEILQGIDLDRLRELLEADRNGRCAVFPCKIGDTVYYKEGRDVKEAKVEEIYTGDGSTAIGVSRGFKTFTLQESEFFLNHESAERFAKGDIK